MSDKSDLITYRFAPDIEWAVELRGILLINHSSGITRFLNYPHVAIWDLMSRGLPFVQVVSMLAAIVSLEQAQAESITCECIQEWTKAGLLIREEEHG